MISKEMVMISETEKKMHEFMQMGTKALHHLYVVGEALKRDTTLADVDKETELYEWEKDLIKLLLMIKPFFTMMIDYFPMLKALIDWASSAYDMFSQNGKIIGG